MTRQPRTYDLEIIEGPASRSVLLGGHLIAGPPLVASGDGRRVAATFSVSRGAVLAAVGVLPGLEVPARAKVALPSRMKAEAFRLACHELYGGLSEASSRFQIDHRTFRRYADGSRPVPEWLVVALEKRRADLEELRRLDLPPADAP